MSGYEVFVSYAHIDNQPMDVTDDATRWVSTLRLNLANLLERKLGERIKVWMDESHLRGHEEVTPEISADVANSKTLVAVISQAYLRSKWCLKELATFLEAPGPSRDRHLFVVLTDDISYGERPPPLQDLVGYQFFETDRRVNRVRQLAVPKPIPTERSYYERLDSLAEDMAAVIRTAVARPTPPPGKPASKKKDEPQDPHRENGNGDGNGNGSRGATIYLAEVGSELYDEHTGMRRFLADQGYRVLPARPYSRTPADYGTSLAADLAHSDLYIQLLGRHPGFRSDELAGGYEGLQFSGAQETGVPTLRWRSPSIELLTIADEQHRGFVGGADVIAYELEDFKDYVRRHVETLLFKREHPLPDIRGSDQYLLLATNPDDVSLAHEMANRLQKACIAYNISQSDDLAAELMSDAYDAVMVFYGAAAPTWVQQAVLNCRRAMVGIKPRPPEGAICIAPPPQDRPLLSKPPRFQIVELGADDDLQEFLDRLALADSEP